MKTKEYIIDNGKLRHCDFNIAKTNPITYHLHFNKWWQILFPVEKPDELFRTMVHLFCYVSQIIPLWWIYSLFYAHSKIKRAKAEVKRQEERRMQNENNN